MTEDDNVAFNELYLKPLMELHRFAFEKIAEQTVYDAYSMIDVYMRYSEIRSKMDVGNWSALNKGCKQVLNSIPKDKCLQYTGREQ